MYCINNEGEIVTKEDAAPKLKSEVDKNQESSPSKEESAAAALALEEALIKQMGLFGKQVIDRLIKEKIPATPENYAIYFEKLLDEKPLNQRQNILKVLETEEIKDHSYAIKTESSVKESFRNIKAILETVSTMYIQINKLKTLTKSKLQEIRNGSGQIALVSYEEHLDGIVSSLERQQRSLKERYSEIAESIKIFQKESVFDPQYDVYNKNFLFNALEAEKRNVINFHYESTVLAFKIQELSLRNIKSTRNKKLIIKGVASLIMKRSRRSDIVAHLGDDIFVMILKHTTLEQAQKAIESIDHMISLSNYIIDSESIDIKLDYGISKIVPNQTKEEIISAAIGQL